MKKKIFIHIYYLEIGGAEISLIGLLNAIDYSLYDVDVFVSKHSGELMALIPSSANLIQENADYNALLSPMKSAMKQSVRIVLSRLMAKIHHYVDCLMLKKDVEPYSYWAKYALKSLPDLYALGTYDLAISFIAPHNICLDKVNAKRKIAWIHTDYSTININTKLELPIWSAYDSIVSISDDVTSSFVKVFPSLASKIIKIENILSPEFVRQRALQLDVKNVMPSIKGRINLLSVGRFCAAKNYDNLPFICRNLINMGADVYWYLIGYGGDEPLIRKNIFEAGVEDRVIILGKKSNPYPYIKACNIYVQPSRYEGKSVTVREAQMLCKPVVITAYPTASSQVCDGVDGVIAPMDNLGCAQTIKSLIDNPYKQKQLTEYLSRNDYGNETEVYKLYDLV